MSKAVTDILGRIHGNVLALQGAESKIAPPPSIATGAPNTTFEQQAFPAALPAKPKREDYEYVKKLLDDISGLAKSASEEIDKELKVPTPPEAEASSQGSSGASKEAHAGAAGAKK